MKYIVGILIILVSYCMALANDFGRRDIYYDGDRYVYRYHVEIVSLHRETNTEGSFFLGIGNINGFNYYIGYKIVGKNEYELFKIRCNESTIVESNDISPRINNYKIDSNWFDIRRYKIYVPVGTIVKEFKLE